jgi:hypothetical protein
MRSAEFRSGEREQPVWNFQAKRLGGLEVEGQFELRWLLNWKIGSRLFLAIPYRAFELRQHAIEYLTRIPAGIFVRHFSIHAQKRIAIFFE